LHDRLAATADRYLLFPDLGLAQSARVLVGALLAFRKVFDVQVLYVGQGGGNAPGDLFVVSDHHPRRPRQRGPDHAIRAAVEPELVPEAGYAQREVRVSGE
jgi:hypothetical protein